MTTLEHGHETRSRILAAARELFARQGYTATSLADIAAAVGLTKTAVAYHFHPKDRLAEEIVAPGRDEFMELLGTDFEGDDRAFLSAVVTFAVRHRTVIRLLMEDIGSADVAPPGSVGETIRAFRDELFDRIAGPSPDETARLRTWAIMGCLAWGVVQTMEMPEETVRATLLSAVLAVHASS